MTATELRAVFNTKFGLRAAWPATYEVDAATYGYVCQAVFNAARPPEADTPTVVKINVGPQSGVMFKNVELQIMQHGNPLQHELLDLITLMPDSQTQEIVDYILTLRNIRRRASTGVQEPTA